MDTLDGLLADLAAESDALEALVTDLPDEPGIGWQAMTPAKGWTVGHQIGHLAWTDEAAALAASDADGFAAWTARQLAEGPVESLVDRAAAARAGGPVTVRLTQWRVARAELRAALLALPPNTKVPWFGPPMAPMSLVTARLMETWAHGEDVAAALGVTRTPTARLRHVARLAYRTRDYAFGVRGLPLPQQQFRVELTAPDGTSWDFGPEEAEQRVTGSALDLCLLAVRRRHRADTDLVATGPDADTWLDVVQAFAGPPGRDPRPRHPERT